MRDRWNPDVTAVSGSPRPGETGDKQRGPRSTGPNARCRTVEPLGKRRTWLLKDIAMAQGELGDRDAARATIKALDLAILGAENRRKGRSKSDLFAVAEAQLAIGDVEEAFGTCIPSSYGDGATRKLSKHLESRTTTDVDPACFGGGRRQPAEPAWRRSGETHDRP